jgi:hypothetical protein
MTSDPDRRHLLKQFALLFGMAAIVPLATPAFAGADDDDTDNDNDNDQSYPPEESAPPGYGGDEDQGDNDEDDGDNSDDNDDDQ